MLSLIHISVYQRKPLFPGTGIFLPLGGGKRNADLWLCLVYTSVKGQLSKIATNISGGMFVTFIAVLIYQLGLGHHLSEIIIGSIIPLVPGVAFTNGIRDIADQHYIAGAVRMRCV